VPAAFRRAIVHRMEIPTGRFERTLPLSSGPWELRTRDFVAERAGAIGFINAAIFNLPATSAEAAGMETRDFYEGDLALYREFTHPAGWNRAQVRRFLADDFAGHPSIAPILRRTPPVFTSSHAPFFVEPRWDTAPGRAASRGGS